MAVGGERVRPVAAIHGAVEGLMRLVQLRRHGQRIVEIGQLEGNLPAVVLCMLQKVNRGSREYEERNRDD